MHDSRPVTRRRTIAGLLLAAVGALAVSACGNSTNGPPGAGSAGAPASGPKGSVEIAIFHSYSGPNAAYGPEAAAGCFPAERLINAAGGILGHKLTCTPVDSKGDPADAVPAANRMIASSSALVGVLGGGSDEATAVVPLFQQAHIPIFSTTGQASFDHSTDNVLLAHPLARRRPGQRDGGRRQEARFHPRRHAVRQRRRGPGIGADGRSPASSAWG